MTQVQTNESSYYDIQRLLPRHYMMMDMLLAGHSQKATAEALGVTTQCVLTVSRSPIFQREFNARQSNIREESNELAVLDQEAKLSKAKTILENAAEGAASTLAVLSTASLDDSVKLRASNSILDKLFGKSNSPSGPQIQVTINTDEVKLLNLALMESMHAKQQSAANSPSAHPAQDQQGDVCQASGSGPTGQRHRQAEDQSSVTVTLPSGMETDSDPVSILSQLNGHHAAPQP